MKYSQISFRDSQNHNLLEHVLFEPMHVCDKRAFVAYYKSKYISTFPIEKMHRVDTKLMFLLLRRHCRFFAFWDTLSMRTSK